MKTGLEDDSKKQRKAHSYSFILQKKKRAKQCNIAIETDDVMIEYDHMLMF